MSTPTQHDGEVAAAGQGTHPGSDPPSSPTSKSSTGPYWLLVVYEVGVGLLCAILLVFQIAETPELPVSPEAFISQAEKTVVYIQVLVLMFLGGMMGGCLWCYRGIMKHSSRGDWDGNWNFVYWIHPAVGGISGLATFFLLFGGVLVLSSPVGDISEAAWYTTSGRLPYVALAILSGFGAWQFMLKVNDLVKTFFSAKDTVVREAGGIPGNGAASEGQATHEGTQTPSAGSGGTEGSPEGSQGGIVEPGTQPNPADQVTGQPVGSTKEGQGG